MTVRIRIDHGQDAGRTWRLGRPGLYVLGRHPDSTIRVLDMKVSKSHASITVGDGGQDAVTLTDHASMHGTLLNGQPVTGAPQPLRAGDEIRLGLTILRVLSDGAADVEASPLAPEQAAALGAAPGGAPTEPPATREAKPARKTLPPDALVGRQIAGYKIKEKVGQGGMGAVYVAEQVSLHREVALKVLSEKFTSDRSFVDQFVNEARAAGALNHPNVVQVYDVGHENGHYYFSMEFVSGGSLEERLKTHGRTDWREALNWFIDASNALIFAKTKGILHRDVKPDNLMVAEDGSTKLCDLGLAKKAENEDLLAAGIIGTPAFISPEAIRRKKDVDARSDLYSLGCAFYRVLTGKNPYAGQNVKEMLLGHLNKPVPRASELNEELPKELDDVLFKLMQKEPDDRFASPQDLLVALDRIRIQHGLEAHGLRPATKRPLVLAAVLGLVAIGAVLFAVTRPDKERIVADPEAEQARLEAAAAQAAAARTAFIGNAQLRLGDLLRQKSAQDISRTWEDPAWTTLAADYERFARGLEEDPDHGDEADVEKLAREARSDAEDIRSYVELRRQLRTVIDEATTTALADLDRALGAHDAKVRAAAETKDWVQAARLLAAETVEGLWKPFAQRRVLDVLPRDTPAEARRRVEGQSLLDAAEVARRVQRAFPGDPAGKARLEALVSEARVEHDRRMRAGREGLERRTPESLAEAIALLEAWLEVLPRTPDPEAGVVAEALRAFRTEATTLKTDVERAERSLFLEDRNHDQNAYVALLKTLRAPGGLLFRLSLDEARRYADEATGAMRLAPYRTLAREAARDVEALAALFQRLTSLGPSGWVHDRVEVVDERGRPRIVKVQEVTATGLRLGLGGEEQALRDLGADWLLHQLFFTKEGAERFAFSPSEQRGLAVLSELAVDYDLARRFWQAVVTAADPEDTEGLDSVRRRFATLDREAAAGRAWRTVVEGLRELAALRRAHDPAVIGEDAFYEEKNREAVVSAEQRIKEVRSTVAAALQALRSPEYADTTWVTVLRTEVVPSAAVEGEDRGRPSRPAPPGPPAPAAGPHAGDGGGGDGDAASPGGNGSGEPPAEENGGGDGNAGG